MRHFPLIVQVSFAHGSGTFWCTNETELLEALDSALTLPGDVPAFVSVRRVRMVGEYPA